VKHPSGPSADHREVEWQFDAVDVRPVERWLQAAGPSVTQGETKRFVDTYADTDDWRLYRAGYSLRLRRRGGRTEATMKALSVGADGLRDRREITETPPAGGLDALSLSEGPVGRRVRAVAGVKAIQPKLEVRTRRRTYLLSSNGSAAAEVAVDSTTIPVGGGEPARLRRIEVEANGVPRPDLVAFVAAMREACGLAPAPMSKFEAGLLASGFTPQPIPDLGPVDISAEASTGEVAFAVLRQHFAAFLRKEGGTRLGEDPEEAHDMRVATRRIRAAIALFGSVLPVRMARYREELGWVASALGAVRDLDVQLEQLEAWAAPEGLDREVLDTLAGALSAQRDLARGNLLQALDSPRYDRLVVAFTAALQHGPLRRSPSSRIPAVAAAPALIKERYRKVRKGGRRIGRTSTAVEYHRLRIRAKRLRYALEFLAPIYGDSAEALIRRTVKLQDLLGAHQDAEVAIARLRTLVADEGTSLPPAAVFAMGEIAQRYREQGAELRRRFPKVFRRVGGKAWVDLRRLMDQRATAWSPLAAQVASAPAAAGGGAAI
jgi:triphosphatase